MLLERLLRLHFKALIYFVIICLISSFYKYTNKKAFSVQCKSSLIGRHTGYGCITYNQHLKTQNNFTNLDRK